MVVVVQSCALRPFPRLILKARVTFSMNPDDPNEMCYMNLDALEDPDAKSEDGKFRFEIRWVMQDDSKVNVIWAQSSHPAESTIRGIELKIAGPLPLSSIVNGDVSTRVLVEAIETPKIKKGNGVLQSPKLALPQLSGPLNLLNYLCFNTSTAIGPPLR